MVKINNLLGANLVSELGIELGANELLLSTMKTKVIGVSWQLIHLPLPHISKLGKSLVLERRQTIKLGLFGPFLLSNLSQTSFLPHHIPLSLSSTLLLHKTVLGRVVFKRMLARVPLAMTTSTAACE
jgi:hypothetical protein